MSKGQPQLSESLRAKLSPADLASIVAPYWQPAEHLLLLNRYLIEVAEKRLKRLIVNLPVRHGKTEMVSGFLPAFYLGVNPDDKVLLAMHTGIAAADQGSFVRDILEMYGDRLYGVHPQRGASSKTNWRLGGRRGRMVSRGVTGSFPGTGADLLLVDDPVRTPAEADSVTHQLNLWNWYIGIARSRLSPNAAEVHVMSRWNVNDHVGRLKQHWDNLGLHYVELHLPALCDAKDDPLGREIGAALWPNGRPKAYDRPALEQIQREIGTRYFSAQYQGRPGEATGAFFRKEWFREYEFDDRTQSIVVWDERGGLQVRRAVPFASLRIRQYVDLASSLSDKADFTVILTAAINPVNKEIYILNVVHVRVTGPEQPPLMHGQFRVWRPQRIKIESVGYQQTFVQNMVAEGLPAFEIKRGRGDKTQHATYAGVRYEQGAVFHPRTAGWKYEFEAELLAFPRGHDDQVDAIAFACNDLLDEDDASDLAGGYLP